MNSRLPKCLFIVMVAYAAFHFLSVYSHLPAVIASHFSARGAANGWQTKQAFLRVFAGMTMLAAMLVFALPALLAVLPRQYVNLPNKEYWLAPARAADSQKFLSGWLAWYGCVVYAVVFLAFDYAVNWNLGMARDRNPASLWYALGAFGAFSVLWFIRMMTRFGRQGRPDNTQ